MGRRAIHGQSGKVKTKLYRAWLAMRNRCNNPRGQDYPSYGGRGISVAPAWDDFFVFAADMGQPPTPLHTVERRNNNGNYEASNCYWGTRKQQSINRPYCKLKPAMRATIKRMYKTGRYTQTELAARFGVTQVRISQVVR